MNSGPQTPLKKKIMTPFYGGTQLPQGCRATTRRQFTFYHYVSRNSWYSFDRPRKDETLSRPWSHQVVLNTRILDWKSSALTTRPLLSCISNAALVSLKLLLSVDRNISLKNGFVIFYQWFSIHNLWLNTGWVKNELLPK